MAIEAVHLVERAHGIMLLSPFLLIRAMAVSAEIMAAIPEKDHSTSSTLVLNEHNSIEVPPQKSLGVAWSPEEDAFMFQYQEPAEIQYTKCGMLSYLSALFNPRGHLAPYTIRVSVMFQELCIG